jgi:PAS domain S-box-containing protein
MLLMDGAGDSVVVDLNPAAQRMFGLEAGQTAGFPLKALYSRQQREAAADEYTRRVSAGDTVRYPWRFVRQNHTEFDAEVTLSRLGNSENDLRLAVIREITADSASSQSADLLRERTTQLDSVTAEFDAFSYAVSHDIRAAISGIAACSRIVMDDFAPGVDEEMRRWLGHIYDDSVQLDKLTEALLELSGASRRTMEPVNLDLTTLASEIARELAAEEPGRNLKFLISEGLEARGDPFLVRTLLRNLLDNARKFTRNATDSRIEFGRRTGNASAEGALFYVRDNGMGFDMTRADRLFVPFQRLHREPDLDGKGIGLAVVRRAIHRHGGRVWAEAAPGSGATFFFTLDGTSR